MRANGLKWFGALWVAGLGCMAGRGAEAPKDLGSHEARPSPEWLGRGVMYQVWLRGFTPEGTLRSAAARLPEVAELGATILYLSPVNLSDPDMRQEFWSKRQKASGTNNPRNPYRISDYDKIDPEYGTEGDLRHFIDTAHGLGLRVLMDLVYFHCGPTSALMDRLGFIQRGADGKAATGSWNFPRLNFECRELREYLWANMARWVRDFGVDGYRCDVSDAVPLDFWEEARARLEVLRPDIVILAEGQRKEDQLKAFDLNYSFSWMGAVHAVFQKGEPASSLRALWEKMRAERPRGARFLRYTENHDIVNDMLRAEVVCGERGAAAVSVVNFTLDGVPMLYNGQEIGDTSPQSIYARWPVGWAAGCLPKPAAKRVLYRELCRLRRAEAALHRGEVAWLENDQPDAVLSFLRRAGGEEILVVANLSNRKVRAVVDMPEGWVPARGSLIESETKASAADGRLVWDLGTCGYFVGRRQ